VVITCIAILLIGLGLLFSPEQSYAFGPLSHVAIGLSVLDIIRAMSNSITDVIASNAWAYLYGCIGPDITFAKNLADFHNHCHNWSIGHRLLKLANTPKKKAFSLGYLSHLAQDTYAHNVFIPSKILRGKPHYISRHIMIEIFTDSYLKAFSKDVLNTLSEKNREKDLDFFLGQVVTPPLFSLKTNKFIFQRMLFVQRLKNWGTIVEGLKRRHATFILMEELQHVLKSSLALTKSILLKPYESECLKFDPTGLERLKLANYLKRQLKKSMPLTSRSFQEQLKREMLELFDKQSEPITRLVQNALNEHDEGAKQPHQRPEWPLPLLSL